MTLTGEANMTLTDLARGIGVSRRTLYNWLNGKTGISLASAKKWERVFRELPPFPVVVPHSGGVQNRREASIDAKLIKIGHRYRKETSGTVSVNRQNGKRK